MYDDIIKKIDDRISDLNYDINSKKGSDLQEYAWKYTRFELENIKKYILYKQNLPT